MTESASAESSSLETRDEATSVGGEAKFWMGQLALAEKDHKDWISGGKDVVARYKNEERRTGTKGNKRFNILYSNTETLKAALFARMAKPDIRRRFADKDPIAKQVAEIVERAAIYCDDSYDADKEFERAIEDYLLPGRGLVRVTYTAQTGTENGKEYVTDQVLRDKYWPWDDFRHEPCKVWSDVTWIAYRHRMSRKALRENFQAGEGGKLKKEDVDSIPLNWTPKAEDDKVPDAYKRAEVWEVWDKETKTRVWVVHGFQKLLRKDEDPYGLEQFFDIAEPICAITANDTLIPRPEFESYRDQADGLDEIEGRIDRLTRALKRRGVYDATITELKRLAKAADNEFIPVKNYADLTTKGGLAAAFQSEDLSIIATVLTELHSQRDLRVQTIYEVVGIADIMRGSSDPRETLGAQKIKAQFGGNRLKKRQDKVQKWIRNTLRLKAEIIAEHFEPQKLAEMTGFKWEPVPPQAPMPSPMRPTMMRSGMAAPPQMSGMPSLPVGQLGETQSPNGGPTAMPGMQQTEMRPGQTPLGAMPPPGIAAPGGMQPGIPQQPMAGQPSVDGKITPEMIAILRNDKLRSYRIDVETDSTVFEDAEAEKAGRTELLKSMSEFMVAWVPIVQAQPQLLPLAFEMLAFGVRGFKAGRQLEESIEQARMQLEDAAMQPQPPSPEQQEAELEKQKVQAKMAADQQAAQQKMAADQQKAQIDLQSAQAKAQMERDKMQAEIQFLYAKLGLQREEMQLEAQAAQQKAAIEAESMERQAANDERSAALEGESMQQKHDMSLEMMAEKAKQAKQRPQPSAR